MADTLTDTTVAIFIAPEGTEQVEFTEPKEAVENAGASVDVVSAETGEVQAVNNDLEPGDSFEVERTFSEISSDEYDALLIPGGAVGADKLRADEDAVGLVRKFAEAGKPIGVICHGPWTLVEADVIEGRTLTSYPSLQTDIRNAGGEWVDEEVVVDQGLVTSRNPDDLPAFCDKVVEEFEEGRH
ncbi:type 1 glutamine amidotransferase domain-containing protein [Haladaptatus pallidirubidus]|uniref:Type 1 glutamine amidotransferase domain-containing protein n=1 Tax=Haladaptatus pallidirubidus TaxID=1008152 RepID=A0AAV3UL47_9EURY|nr:type 1 glutamine amidotransferase domain-containing protein [Haladaptatus pallidirubidus]